MIGNREFVVGHTKSEDEYLGFFVTDCFDNAELQKGTRPTLVTFPVSELYDAAEQKYRAEQYAEFMNKIAEATRKTYEQTMLIDVMKGNKTV